MEFIELAVRIHLDHFDAPRGADPDAWFVMAKADGTACAPSPQPTATVAVHAAVTARPGFAKPSVGIFATTLRGPTGPVLAHTRFATLVFAVAALDHGANARRDIDVVRSRVIAESKRRLGNELRDIAQEVLAGSIPSLAEVRKRLDSQFDADEFTSVVDDVGRGLVSRNVDTVPTFPDLLAHAIDGVPIDVPLRRVDGKVRSRLTGVVERTDIHEPPTIGLACLGDGRLRICGRSAGKRAFTHERSATGVWGSASALGDTALSSGVTVATGTDGARTYAVARGLDRTIRIKLPDSGDSWDRLPGGKFATGAGVACSADGSRVYVAATAEDGNVHATIGFDGGARWTDWMPTGVRSIASPALACSADGATLFLATLGEDRRLYESVVDTRQSDLRPTAGTRIGSLRFRSAPGCACSGDGARRWIGAVGDDGQLRVGGPGRAGWSELGEVISAPALACSTDGKRLHVAAIDKALRLRHRSSTDGGAGWPKPHGVSWEVLRENAAWF